MSVLSAKQPRVVVSSKLNVVDSRDLLMVSLAKFYSHKSYVQKIIPIIEGKSDISLRLIDWFVTNYSKKHTTIITRSLDNNIVHFNVYLSYRSQLKAYSKQQFDPFRRRDRIKFYYEKDGWIETTIGQLNFFRWILQNNILEFIAEYNENIENDMVSSQKEHQQKKSNEKSEAEASKKNNSSSTSPSSKKKRNELCKSFVKNMNKFSGARKISFD